MDVRRALCSLGLLCLLCCVLDVTSGVENCKSILIKESQVKQIGIFSKAKEVKRREPDGFYSDDTKPRNASLHFSFFGPSKSQYPWTRNALGRCCI
jgi:hypothetical protein